MKPWRDLSEVQMPPRIQALPKDERGYPIPHGVFWENGIPDFRKIDPEKWAECASKKLCGICGKRLEKNFAFIGGYLSIKNRLFSDSPTHIECAVYALQVCPFLAIPKFGYIEREGETNIHVYESISTKKPEIFGMGITNKYQLVQFNGDILLRAGWFSRITMWRAGQQIDNWE